jgi:hypothetical protein
MSGVIPQAVSRIPRFSTRSDAAGKLWLPWVEANIVGDFVGLAAAGILAGAAAWSARLLIGPLTGTVMLAILVLAALVEGALVGLSQWLVLQNYVEKLTGKVWVLATSVGAGIAWIIGTRLVDAGFVPEVEPRLLVVNGAIFGFVVGATVGVAQWLALRHLVERAGWWVLANIAAWTLGLMTFFGVVSFAETQTRIVVVVFIWILSGFLGGLVAAAIHGLALLGLLKAPLEGAPFAGARE